MKLFNLLNSSCLSYVLVSYCPAPKIPLLEGTCAHHKGSLPPRLAAPEPLLRSWLGAAAGPCRVPGAGRPLLPARRVGAGARGPRGRQRSGSSGIGRHSPAGGRRSGGSRSPAVAARTCTRAARRTHAPRRTRTRTHVAARPARGTPSTAGPRPPARPAPAAPERPRGTPPAAAPRLPRAPPVPARGGRGAGARRFRGGRKAASRAGRRGALPRLSPRKKPSRARPCSPGFGTEKVPRYGQKGSPRVSQHHKSDNNAEQTEYHSRAISMSNIPLLSSSICKCELQTKLPAKSTERLVHTFTPTPVTGYHHTAIPLAEPFHPSPCLQMEMIPIGPRCPCK